MKYRSHYCGQVDKSDLNQITKILIQNPEPIIFDVGANKGQSIERYKKLFSKSEIHSFEPNPVEVNNMKEKDSELLFHSPNLGSILLDATDSKIILTFYDHNLNQEWKHTIKTEKKKRFPSFIMTN